MLRNPSFERIRMRAQQTADNDGRPVAILNLNPYSPLYVIREWDDRYTVGHGNGWQFVARIDPLPTANPPPGDCVMRAMEDEQTPLPDAVAAAWKD